MKKAGDLLHNFFDEKVMKTAKEYSQLFSVWIAVAGDQCAAHSRIIDLKGTLLIVEADHPGWVQILQTRQTELLTSIQRKIPHFTISSISFKLSKNLNQLESELPQKQEEYIKNYLEEETIYPQEKIDTGKLYDNIHDENFKESLRRLEESITLRNTNMRRIANDKTKK